MIFMFSEASDGEKKSKTWIIIIIAVVVGLICLGIFVLLVWRFKRKRKGITFISIRFFFSSF